VPRGRRWPSIIAVAFEQRYAGHSRLAAGCVAVGRAEGARLDESVAAEAVAQLAARPAGAGSSILTDWLAGRPLEWEARNAIVRRLGVRHGIPTPASDVTVPLLAACGLPSPGPGSPADR
jgi:2-dehydropantoate 2-reductase